MTRQIRSALRKCVWAQGWLRPLRRKIHFGYGTSARAVTSPGSDAEILAERSHLEAEQGGAVFVRQVAYRAAVVARQACEWADICWVTAEATATGEAPVDAWSTFLGEVQDCLLYTSPSPRDGLLSRMPSSA